MRLAVQFKWDQKVICLFPLTTVHIFPTLRSHGPELEGRVLATLWGGHLAHAKLIAILVILIASLVNKLKLKFNQNEYRLQINFLTGKKINS